MTKEQIRIKRVTPNQQSSPLCKSRKKHLSYAILPLPFKNKELKHLYHKINVMEKRVCPTFTRGEVGWANCNIIVQPGLFPHCGRLKLTTIFLCILIHSSYKRSLMIISSVDKFKERILIIERHLQISRLPEKSTAFLSYGGSINSRREKRFGIRSPLQLFESRKQGWECRRYLLVL